MIAALRIIWDTLVFRLKRREMNNLVASITLAVALHAPWLELGTRVVYALLLNIYVYLINDLFDLDLDAAAPSKDQRKVSYLAEHKRAGIGACVALAAAMAGLAWLHVTLAINLAINTVLILAYSGWLKRTPVADVISMIVWGAAMSAAGIPDHTPWATAAILLGLLALFSGAYEVLQVIRDEPEDRESGLRTTAVVLGAKRAKPLYYGAVIGATAYSALLPYPTTLPCLIALFLPLTAERASRSWDMLRAIFGACWLLTLAGVYLR